LKLSQNLEISAQNFRSRSYARGMSYNIVINETVLLHNVAAHNVNVTGHGCYLTELHTT
jgi:hypothetical protein